MSLTRSALTQFILKKISKQDKTAGDLSNDASVAIMALSDSTALKLPSYGAGDRRQAIETTLKVVKQRYGVNGANAFLNTLSASINPMEETAAPTPEKLYFEYQTNVPKGTRIKSFDDWKKNDWVDRPQSPEEMADQPQPSGEQN